MVSWYNRAAPQNPEPCNGGWWMVKKNEEEKTCKINDYFMTVA